MRLARPSNKQSVTSRRPFSDSGQNHRHAKGLDLSLPDVRKYLSANDSDDSFVSSPFRHPRVNRGRHFSQIGKSLHQKGKKGASTVGGEKSA